MNYKLFRLAKILADSAAFVACFTSVFFDDIFNINLTFIPSLILSLVMFMSICFTMGFCSNLCLNKLDSRLKTNTRDITKLSDRLNTIQKEITVNNPKADECLNSIDLTFKGTCWFMTIAALFTSILVIWLVSKEILILAAIAGVLGFVICYWLLFYGMKSIKDDYKKIEEVIN